MTAEDITGLFAKKIRLLFRENQVDYETLYEIRMRIGSPIFLYYKHGEDFIKKKEKYQSYIPYIVTSEDMKETLEYLSGYSLYAYEEEVRQGFLSIQGGHRVGVCGKVNFRQNQMNGMEYITAINIRISHQVIGCATKILPYIEKDGHIYHTLIISPPRCGKTTLLRDLIRQISNGWDNIPGSNVGVVDERSELAGCYHGIPQNDLGIRTDVLDACPKAEGMMMLIRSMAPKVIAVDELGKEEDYHAVEEIMVCGCCLLATIHGSSLEDLIKKPFFKKIWEQKMFERYIFLAGKEKPGTVLQILDQEGNSCM